MNDETPGKYNAKVQFRIPSQCEVLLGAVAEDGDGDDDGDGGEGATQRHAEHHLARGLRGVRVGGAALEQV